MSGRDADPWALLRAFTDARVGQGCAGTSLPTRELLAFTQAHAAARDAVHADADFTGLRAALDGLGEPVLEVRSRAPDRATYVRRPDLGRALHPASAAELDAWHAAHPEPLDVAVVVADGLSARALAQVPGVLGALLPELRREGFRLAPVVFAAQARVALGDGVALALGARLVLVLIGERPGLSSPDSLGAYVTHAPQPVTPDSARNCVSNIRPAGLDGRTAAWRLHWLILNALRRALSGVPLKDDSGEVPRHFAPHALPRGG
ncbi:ethanolamine ammonia-lyase small subunit [Deinococcus metalli]|uniref:Ethanolamine ammonia-lyase small subunit n=1 Tax=Deinococcus metalli TaxID=1141878 RepID=A0A7W8KEV1_9DEIO|nr:ethanolamine ammonia-lyase subunit EutC [Deinococcus metalli]MBB5376892.1 ethanolamine ammonia-lyase small subunit [Deinococcus metalli]GHF46134.1 ethanolamine ammonia-lyase light chain [Deinococcus metalli]